MGLEDSTVFGLFDGDGGGGGFGLGDLWQGLNQFASSPVFGMYAGARMSEQEQERWDRHALEQRQRAGRAVWREHEFFRGYEGDEPGDPSVEGLIPFTERFSGQQRAEAERFYGGAPQRFERFAQPIRAGLGRISAEARGRLGQLGAGYAGLERRGMRGAAEIARGFGGLETEGRAGAADLVRRQEARERGLLGQLEGLGGQERRDIRQAYGAEGAAEQVRLGQMGMAGTSAAGGAAMGVARRRTESLGRLEERLRRERIGLTERQTGQTMQARAGALELGLGLGRERLGAEAGALEMGLGLTRERLGFGTEAMGYMTDLESRRLGATAQLGGAGLEYGDVAWQNLMGERERLEMMPWEARREELDRRQNLLLDRIQWQPPYVGQGQQLWGAAGTQVR